MRLDLIELTRGSFKLEDISFILNEGDVLGIIGEEGSGKTTLIKGILGNYKFEGNFILKGENLSEISNLERTQDMSYLSQEDSENNSTLLEVCLNEKIPFMKSKENIEDIKYIEGILISLNLADMKYRSLSSMSVGERRLSQIAKVLSKDAELYLLDDPTKGLSEKTSEVVFKFIKEKVKKEKIRAIVVSNNSKILSDYCDKFLILQGGKQVAFGDKNILKIY